MAFFNYSASLSNLNTNVASKDSAKIYATDDGHLFIRGKEYLSIDHILDLLKTADALVFKGEFNAAATGAAFPKGDCGDVYKVSNAGTVNGKKLEIGDTIICTTDGTAAGTAANWIVLQNNIDQSKIKINNTEYTISTPSANNNLFSFFAPTTGGTANNILISKGTTATPEWQNPTNIKVGEAGKVTYALTAGTGLSMGKTGNTANTFNGSAARTIALTAATNIVLGGVIVPLKINDADATNTNLVKIDTNGKITVSAVDITTAIGGDVNSRIKSYDLYVSASSGEKDVTGSTKQANPYINLIQTLNGTESVSAAISLNGGSGINITGEANKKITISQTVATSGALGGIQIGYTDNDKNYAVKLDSNNKAYVNVPWVENDLILGDTAELATHQISNLANGNVFLNFLANSSVSKTYKLAGTNMTITASSGNQINFKVPIASSSLGVVKSGATVAASKTYGVAIDANGAMTVSVPWQNDNTWREIKVSGTSIFGTATSTKPLNILSGGKTTITPNANNGTITFSSTWRDIQIAGTSIGDDTLNINPTEDIFIFKDTNATDSTSNIGFGILWYNVDNGNYEAPSQTGYNSQTPPQAS